MLGLAVVIGATAIPQALASRDAARAMAAARFLCSRLMLVRARAVQRHAARAIRLETDDRGVRISEYQDGNHNGVHARDIDLHIDWLVEQPVRIAELFPGVEFGLRIDAQDLDPIQLGGTNLLTFTPGGTSSAGSLYLRGRNGAQFAVRVLGATGRARVQRYDERQQKWVDDW